MGPLRRSLATMTVVGAAVATWGSVGTSTGAAPQSRGAAERWDPSPANPVVGMNRPPQGFRSKGPVIWNDPSVMREGDHFTMWASAGHGGPKDVAIYKLRSTDGVSWAMDGDGRPVLEPGSKKDFDSLGVETPVVVKADSTYHMYYSAYPHGRVPLVTIGHATSPDGTHWTKRGELESITSVVGTNKGNPWGRLGRGEPAAMYRDGTFYLFFTDVRCRTDNCKGSPAVVRGISLATSRDGHTFQQRGTQPVLLPSGAYVAERGWEGYSTPWAMWTDGRFDLFCDVFRAVGKQSIQTALAHFQSSDGTSFSEVTADLLIAGREPWAEVSIRSPSVVVSDGVWRMWYAGDNWDPDRNKARGGGIAAGIGMATLRGR